MNFWSVLEIALVGVKLWLHLFRESRLSDLESRRAPRSECPFFASSFSFSDIPSFFLLLSPRAAWTLNVLVNDVFQAFLIQDSFRKFCSLFHPLLCGSFDLFGSYRGHFCFDYIFLQTQSLLEKYRESIGKTRSCNRLLLYYTVIFSWKDISDNSPWQKLNFRQASSFCSIHHWF